MKSRAIALVVLLSLLGVARGSGSCFQGERNRVATVTVDSCVDLPAFAARRLEGTALPWVVKIIGDVLEQQNGVVVKGTVTRKLYVTQFSDTVFQLEDSVLAEEPGEWFVKMESEASCDPYPAGREIELYVAEKCCDVFPPYDVPCALDTGQAWPVPAPLKRML